MTTTPSSRPLTRRAFVGSVVALLGSAVFGSAFAVQRKWGALERRWNWYSGAHLPLEGRIRQHFEYLSLDPAGLTAFAQQYQKENGDIGFFSAPEPEVYERYLLSTDFFQNGADESKPLRYVAYYDPYVSPCWNPCVDWT